MCVGVRVCVWRGFVWVGFAWFCVLTLATVLFNQQFVQGSTTALDTLQTSGADDKERFYSTRYPYSQEGLGSAVA